MLAEFGRRSRFKPGRRKASQFEAGASHQQKFS